MQTSGDLAHAYEAMANCDGAKVNECYEVHAEAHRRITGVMREAEKWFREVEEMETQDYRRTVLGALEAYTRRQQLSSRILDERQSLQNTDRDRALKRIETMEADLAEATADLKRDFEDVKRVLEQLKATVTKSYVAAMKRISEEMRKVWTDAHERIAASAQG